MKSRSADSGDPEGRTKGDAHVLVASSEAAMTASILAAMQTLRWRSAGDGGATQRSAPGSSKSHQLPTREGMAGGSRAALKLWAERDAPRCGPEVCVREICR